MEIERKFLLKTLPPAEILANGEELTQIYLRTEPGEVRLRREGGKVILSVKSDGDLAREEWGTVVPAWIWDLYQGLPERIEKTRYRHRDGDHLLEIDVFHGRHETLIVLEVEFPDETSAQKFHLPPWAADAQEVTEIPAYKNKHLAQK